MKNRLLIVLALALLVIPLASAEFLSHKQNENLGITFAESSASSCNISNIIYPNGTTRALNKQMSKSGQTFNSTINSSYFQQLGNTCFIIDCGTDESGSICREITPSGFNGNSNIVFHVLIISLLWILTLFLFFKKDIELAPFISLSGGALGFLGLYTIQNGIIIFRDYFTNMISYISIGFGFGLALWALIEWIQEMM